jgi:tripartite-type tricarboxylate transporter receptor subunit TctC
MKKIVFLISLLFSSLTFAKEVTTLILPTGPGGIVHKYAIELEKFLQKELGTVVIEFKPGAQGAVGAASLAEIKTSKLTLMMGTVQNWPTNPLTDIVPVAYMGTISAVIFARPQENFKDFRGVLEQSKSSVLSYGFPSSSNNQKLIKILSEKHGKPENFTEVPYRSGAGVIADVLGGHLKFGVSIPQSIQQHVKSNNLVALAVYGSSRSSYLPDVPTLSELSLNVDKEFKYDNNMMLFANKNANKNEIDKLRMAIKKYFESDESLNIRKVMDINFGKNSPTSPEKIINEIISKQ